MPSPDGQSIDARADALDEFVAHSVHRDENRGRHAAFAGRAKPRAHRRFRRVGEVRVGQHDHVILGSAQSLDALALAGRRLVDVARDRGRSHETHRLDIGMSEDAIDGDLSP